MAARATSVLDKARLTWRRFGRASLVLATLPTLVVACSSPSASATDAGLSSVLLSNTLPGFVAAPAGVANGPITDSDFDTLFGKNSKAEPLAAAMANGQAIGYLRVWDRVPIDGDGVIILAFELPTSGDASSFLAGVTASVQSGSRSSFAVPGIAFAKGFSRLTNGTSGTRSEYQVTFARGTTVFDVSVVTASRSLDAADAVKVASEQAAQAPGPPLRPAGASSSEQQWRRVLNGLVLAIIGIAAMFFIARRPGRRRVADTNAPAAQPSRPSVLTARAIR